jgi:hypothetical protein
VTRSLRVLRSTALLIFLGVVGALAALPLVGPKPSAHQLRQQLLAELQPVALRNCTLRRFGSANDGGYLMCENLFGNAASAYSYGIGPTDDWGCDVSDRYGLTVHQYDCFNPPRAGCPNGRSVFHDECIGPTTETIDSRIFDTLTNQISKNGDAGKTLIVKIDVEGAELKSLMATPNRVLGRIDQLAMEIHGTNRRFLALVRKLKRTFYLVHVHYNNYACTVLKSRPLPAWAYQVLFVNKRIGVLDPARPAPTLPSALDAPDLPGAPDCQVPGLTEPEAFKTAPGDRTGTSAAR